MASYTFSDIQALPEEIKQGLYDRLWRGESLEGVAAWLQEEKGQFTKITRKSLHTKLWAYRSKIVMEDKLAGIRKRLGRKDGKWIAKVDTLEELYALADTQKLRLLKILDTESQNPALLIDVASKQIRDYQSLLVEIARLEMDLGIRHKAPTRIEGSLRPSFGEQVDWEPLEDPKSLFDRIGDELRALAGMDGAEEDEPGDGSPNGPPVH